MLSGNLLMIFLIWYLPNVLPWASESPQHPLFCLSPRYWTSFKVLSVPDNITEKPQADRFEPEPSHLQPIIVARGITQKFGGKTVLSAVDVSLYASQVTVVAGPHGAGKTALLKILAGLLRPTHGRVEISHPAPTDDPEGPVRIAMCPQNNVLFDDLTVWEHLAYSSLEARARSGAAQVRGQDQGCRGGSPEDWRSP
ncbi:hypothetical protein MTO96_033614 [Rhipicephalus appendiculatus]